MLIVMAGLPGTGKSTLARHLAHILPTVILDKDVIRASLFPPQEIEYSTQQDDFCLSIMLQVAEYLFRKDARKYIILDGRTFSRRYQLASVIATAQKLQSVLKIIECICSEETAKRRLEDDLQQRTHQAKNRDYALYMSMKTRQEPIIEPKLVVDTDDDLQTCVQQCLTYIKDEVQ